MSSYTTRLRIDQISDRTSRTILPSIDEAYAKSDSQTIDGGLSRTFIDQMTFSDYPGAKNDGAAAMSAFLMNSVNLNELKQSGSLGAVIELLRRTNVEKDPNSVHVENLVQSLHILTVRNGVEDKTILQRLLTNPHGAYTIVRLCRHTFGKIQSISMDILLALSTIENGMSTLIEHHVMAMLMSPELLYRKGTLLNVRHSAAKLIYQIVSSYPNLFSVEKFISLTLASDGTRRIDGYMEIQLLQSFLIHLSWLQSHGKTLPIVFTLFDHLIDELQSEAFEHLDHMQLIVRAITMASDDPTQLDFMIDHGLGSALQYLVKTDFLLFRKKHVKVSGKESEKQIETMKKKKYKRLSIQDSGERPTRTLLALSVINGKDTSAGGSNDEINYFATKSAINTFENIMQHRVDIISEIVTSGLLPALLFRVGVGVERDVRFNKLMVSFLFNMLKTIVLEQEKKGAVAMTQKRISSLAILPRERKFVRHGQSIEEVKVGGTKTSGNKSGGGKLFSTNRGGPTVAVTDMRAVSNTMHAQGVTSVLLQSIFTDDISLVKEAILCISVLSFSVIEEELTKEENVRRIIFLLNNRSEVGFFPLLSLFVEIILSRNTTERLLNVIVEAYKGIRILIKSLQLSGWLFHMKDLSFKAVAKLSFHPKFRDFLIEYNGLSTILTDIHIRMSKKKKTRRRDAFDDIEDDDGTEQLLKILKRDYAACKIQSCARIMLSKKRVKSVALAKAMATSPPSAK